MLASGKEFIFIYTPKHGIEYIPEVVKHLANSEEFDGLETCVFCDVEDIPDLFDRMFMPKNHIFGISKITYSSPTDFVEHDIEELFTEQLIEMYEKLFFSTEDIEDELPPICRETKAYEAFLENNRDSEAQAAETEALKQWYQAVCL